MDLDNSSSETVETPAEMPVETQISEIVAPAPAAKKSAASVKAEPKAPEAPAESHVGYMCLTNIRHDGVLYGSGTELPNGIMSEEQLEQLRSSGSIRSTSFEGA